MSSILGAKMESRRKNSGKFDCDKMNFLTKLRMRLISRRGEEEAM